MASSDVIKIEKINNIVHITFMTDELGASESDSVRVELEAIVQQGFKKLIIDLSGINFITSLFIATIITISQRVRLQNGDIKICSVRTNVKKIFEITRLDKVFDIYDTYEKALESFSKT